MILDMTISPKMMIEAAEGTMHRMTGNKTIVVKYIKKANPPYYLCMDENNALWETNPERDVATSICDYLVDKEIKTKDEFWNYIWNGDKNE